MRGWWLLTTNPTAPNVLVTYVNLGRQIANAGYSSTASIVLGTDEPVTSATNPLGLSRTHDDERGQVWKWTSHQIDAAHGSDDYKGLRESVWVNWPVGLGVEPGRALLPTVDLQGALASRRRSRRPRSGAAARAARSLQGLRGVD